MGHGLKNFLGHGARTQHIRDRGIKITMALVTQNYSFLGIIQTDPHGQEVKDLREPIQGKR